MPIPADLQALAAGFAAKRKAGTAQAHGSGFGGTGFKFDTNEEETRKQARRVSAVLSIHMVVLIAILAILTSY